MSEKHMLETLARRLATCRLPDPQLKAIAGAISASRHPVLGVDACTHGICIDLGFDGDPTLIDMADIVALATGPIRRIEIFPEGIITPDRARIRLTQAV